MAKWSKRKNVIQHSKKIWEPHFKSNVGQLAKMQRTTVKQSENKEA